MNEAAKILGVKLREKKSTLPIYKWTIMPYFMMSFTLKYRYKYIKQTCIKYTARFISALQLCIQSRCPFMIQLAEFWPSIIVFLLSSFPSAGICHNIENISLRSYHLMLIRTFCTFGHSLTSERKKTIPYSYYISHRSKKLEKERERASDQYLFGMQMKIMTIKENWLRFLHT